MKLVSLDLNGSRVRALGGAMGLPPAPIALDAPELELPMALGLESRRPEVGRAGRRLCRRFPHLAVMDFLGAIGSERIWPMGRKSITADEATRLVLETLRGPLAGHDHAVLCLPAYLERAQVELLQALFRKIRIPVAATLAAPIALTCAVLGQAKFTTAITLEVDEHGLSLSRVQVDGTDVRLVDNVVVTDLGLMAWYEAILNGIAEVCVRQSRRDYRDSGAAEQGLFDQIPDVLRATENGELIEVVVRTRDWCQNMILQPERVEAMTTALARGAAGEVIEWIEKSPRPKSMMAIMSDEAAALPGLRSCLCEELSEPVQVVDGLKSLAIAHEMAGRRHRSDCGPWDHLPLAEIKRRDEPSIDGARSIRIKPR